MSSGHERFSGWIGLVTAMVLFGLMLFGGIYGIVSLLRYIWRLIQ